MPDDDPPARALVDPATVARRRDAVLALLREAGRPLSIGDLAEGAGLHANTVRFHLAALVEEGRVERAPASTGAPGRPRLLYRARPGSASGPRSYRLLAGMLTELVTTLGGGGPAAVEAGRSWGRRLLEGAPGPLAAGDAVARMNALLDDIGFQPSVHGNPAAGAEVHLHHCPFREVAEAGTEVVCALHLGLMQGVLREVQAPVTTTSLRPFVRPDLCVARVDPAEEARS